MGQPSTIYKPGKLNYVWNYLSSTLDNFKAKLLGYRTYKALLTQTGSDAPVATVLENSLKLDITYEYDSTGLYYAYTYNDLFNDSTTTLDGRKVEVFITPSNALNGLSNNLYTFTAYPVFFFVIEITSYNNGGLFEDDALGQYCSTVLEIRVYNK